MFIAADKGQGALDEAAGVALDKMAEKSEPRMASAEAFLATFVGRRR
jgi:hypothetical protein